MDTPDRERFHPFGLLLREFGFIMSRRHPAASLNRRYLAALLCIAGLIVLDQVLIQPELARLAFDAPVINVSGRQRMLSQRLAKTALVLQQSTTGEQRTTRHSELKQVVDLWTRSHRGLQVGDQALNLPGNNPPVAKASFERIEPHFTAIRSAADELLQATAGRQAPNPANIAARVTAILEHEPAFLQEMDKLVGIYEAETRQHVAQLERTSWTIAAAILATMWVLHMIAIRPATQLLERQYVETQDQYRAVVESINEGLIRLDTQGRILFANQQFSRLAGRSSDEVRGLVAATLFRGPKVFLWPQGDDDAVAGEMELLCASAEPHLCWVSPCRLADASGGTSGWVILVMDVSEKRAAERRTQALTDQLTHADRLKSMGEIAAGLAHEVNQPLGAIANFAEGCLVRIAAGDASFAELEPPLRRILGAALRAGGIIRRVKQFSQKRPHTLAEAELNSLVQETVELFTMELQRRRVACELQLSPVPLPIECDALQVGQVLTNLLQNAMHALEQSAAEARVVEIHTTAASADEILLIVRDHGPGFPEAILGRLFEPFSTSRPDGLGMGMSIVRSIVEAHSGSITAENLEQGAQVTIRLPARQRAFSRSTNPAEPAHAG